MLVNCAFFWYYHTYTYDHMGRKRQTQESINGGTNVVVSQLDYNEIGQLLTKHLHSTNSGSSFLQNVAYTYNERSWLLSENAPLFSEQLQYNTGTNKQYNGNIAYQLYQSAATPATTTYAYTYDQLNRHTSGTSSDNYNETGISYDLNGNIQTLQRTYGSATVVDNLAYSYGGTNQVQSISDAAPDMTAGKFYPKGTFAYTYDPNGNIWTDASKGITANISYNLLNLPAAVTANGKTAAFTYDAAGRKLRKVSAISGVNTDYIDGIQYEAGAISFIQTEEGRALNSSGNYHYEYSLTDHLGNSRLTFDTYSGSASTVQQDDYLPFGYEITRGTVTSPKNEYLYNKKELQEDLMLEDYGARFYDPLVARWTSIDPLAEISRRFSPYNYVEDNPVKLTDPDGMSATWDDNGNAFFDGAEAQNFARGLQADEKKNGGNEQPPKKKNNNNTNKKEDGNGSKPSQYWPDWFYYIPVVGSTGKAGDDLKDGNYGSAALDEGSGIMEMFIFAEDAVYDGIKNLFTKSASSKVSSLSSMEFEDLQTVVKSCSKQMNLFFKAEGETTVSKEALNAYKELITRILDKSGGAYQRVEPAAKEVFTQRLKWINRALNNIK